MLHKSFIFSLSELAKGKKVIFNDFFTAIISIRKQIDSLKIH